MSRSSTDRAGIAIGRERLGFARVGRSGKPAFSEAKLKEPLFKSQPGDAAREALAEALREQAGDLARRYVPLHVTVPDAAVRWASYELDQMPRTQALRRELARFRFEREGAAAGGACACQPLGREGARPLLFAMAMDGAWLRLISEALAAAGLRAWTLNANACRQWNRFHERLVRTSGALVAAAADAWSLALWDERGVLRYVRARWRLASGDEREIAAEAERAILAYSQGGKSVARVFAVAEGGSDALAAALDERLREPCVRLEGEPPALAAALER